jgi:flagellar basal-body rod modification protein FlgD
MTVTTGNSYLDSLVNKTSSSGTGSTTPKSSGTIDQAGFLKLLTTQLQTQDPTAPVDNTQMVAQMAQFSSVAGISEMNTSLKSMASDIAAARFGDASGWIGRGALVSSSVAAAMSNGAYAGQITLPAEAKDVTITLVDASGQSVFAKDLGAKDAGSVDWSWDGKDASGKAVAGPLQMIVGAVGTSGTSLKATNASWTEVQSVMSPASGTTTLNTALGSFAPSDVLQLG